MKVWNVVVGGLCLTSLYAAGCASNEVLVRDGARTKIIAACSQDELCFSQNQYDVQWLRCGNFPVSYRASQHEYYSPRTEYVYQSRVVVSPPPQEEGPVSPYAKNLSNP